MQSFNLAKRRRFTDAARQAALAARLAKRAEPDQFGIPELFIVRKDKQAFAWELRRFGGVLLQRGEQAFATLLEAKAAGADALAALCSQADLPVFQRELRSKAVPPSGTPT